VKNPFNSFRKNSWPLAKVSKALEHTGLFDQTWYQRTYSEVSASPLNPFDHYILEGEEKGYQPNPYFQPDWYKKQSKGARRGKMPALLHYARLGWKNGKDPSPAFCGSLYSEQYTETASLHISPLQHFLQIGQYTGKLAFPRSVKFAENSDELLHDMLLIADSGLFKSDWYREYYSDMWANNMDPLVHFVTLGHMQDRKPNPIFETCWYRQQHTSDVGKQNPLVSFILIGEKKGFNPAPDFHTNSYYKLHPALKKKGGSALAHYLHVGLPQGEDKPQSQVRKQATAKKAFLPSAKLPIAQDLRALSDFETKPLSPDALSYDPAALNIHWVIPDFAAGGGGHMTIFRMARFLEYSGHKQTFWINNPSMHENEANAADTILKHFQQFTGTVKFLDKRFESAKGDVVIATDCWTVWPTLSATNFKRRFYFVQDFEPSFHPMGSHYLAAEQTYKQDIDCICASPWLAKLMVEKYGRWASHFWLAADNELYHPPVKLPANKRPRIAFYARHFTARRAVELGMLALEVAANKGLDFEVDFFGAPIEFSQAPFRFKDHGVASPEQLATIFQQADIGVVFSATNYSLVPQEMMSCGLAIVELKGESTSCIFPADTVTLAEPHPVKIADAIADLINDAKKRQNQVATASKWVNGFSWKASAKAVEAALLERLADSDFEAKSMPKQNGKLAIQKPMASVIIPTLDAGPGLARVLEAVTNQKTPWPYEVLVIDSGSTDGTLELIQKYPCVKLHQIDKKDFNHGGTRNLGAQLTTGEFIAFLTHDALPANENWLYNLVTALAKHPKAAGAFGKHLPYAEASAFTKRDLNTHFDLIAAHPLYVDKKTNKKRYDDKDQGWRQFLHFYSDNNSCMRRSVWKKIPYREVKFGEDQIWADDIIKAGYGKVYAIRAAVYHSHDFAPEENRERNMIEAAFFKHFFGYSLIKDQEELTRNITFANKHDEAWGAEHRIGKREIQKRTLLNEARLKGYLEGWASDTKTMF